MNVFLDLLENLVVGLSEASGEWSSITNIIESGGIENVWIEHEAEARTFYCTVSTEIQIPFILLLFKA